MTKTQPNSSQTAGEGRARRLLVISAVAAFGLLILFSTLFVPRDRGGYYSVTGKWIKRATGEITGELLEPCADLVLRAEAPIVGRTAANDAPEIAARAAGAPVLRVQVAGAEGRPVAGATVRVRGDTAESATTGTTSAAGTFEAPSGSARSVAVDVASTGYAAARTRIRIDRGSLETVCQLSLTPGVTVSGRVFDPEGRPASGVPVLLFPDALVARVSEALDEMSAQRSAVRRTKTSDDGTFTVESVDPRQPLSLLAAGSGLASTWARVSSNALTHDLHLEHVYAAGLWLQASDERAEHVLRGAAVHGTQEVSSDIELEFMDPLASLAAGVPASSARRTQGYSQVWAYRSRTARERAGVIHMYLALAASDGISARADLMPLASGMTWQIVSVGPDELGLRGERTLAFRYRGDYPAVSDLAPELQLGSLHLLDHEDRFVRSVPIVDLDRQIRIDALPDSALKVLLESQGPGLGLRFVKPSGELTRSLDVLAPGDLTIEIDRANCGAIEVLPDAHDLCAYTGPISIRYALTSPPGDEVGLAMLSRPPYLLEGLEPGNYDLQVTAAAGTQDYFEAIRFAAVEPGQIVRVTMED